MAHIYVYINLKIFHSNKFLWLNSMKLSTKNNAQQNLKRLILPWLTHAQATEPFEACAYVSILQYCEYRSCSKY